MEITEAEKPYLELVKEIMLEMALRPIRMKRDKRGRIEIGVSVTQTIWVDCRNSPQIGVWNGETIQSGRMNIGGQEFGFTGGTVTIGNTTIPLKNTKAVTWIEVRGEWSRGQIADLVWKGLPAVRKVIHLQQQPRHKIEVSIHRNMSNEVYIFVAYIQAYTNGIGGDTNFVRTTKDDPHLVALGRSYILGDCPEAVFIEGLCEANEQIRDLVYPKELD